MSKSKDIRKSDKKKPQKTTKEKKQEKIDKNKNKSWRKKTGQHRSVLPGDSWLLASAGDFNQVESELGLNRTMDFTNFIAEDDFIKFRNHLTRRKFSQGPSLFSGWT